ncbi:MAG: hypothetical protein OXH10_02705, partial [bacterium]|nr:hypothetical protein [bacterium]
MGKTYRFCPPTLIARVIPKPKGLLLIGLLLVGLVFAFFIAPQPTSVSAQNQQNQPIMVPNNWPLVPDGIGPNEQFRLLFVTKDKRHSQVR